MSNWLRRTLFRVQFMEIIHELTINYFYIKFL